MRLRLLVSVVEAFLEFEGSLRMELDLQANGIAPGVPAHQLDVHALERGVGLHEAVVDPRLRQPRGIEYAQDAGISQHERLRGQHDAIAQSVAHPRGGGLRRLTCLAHHPAQLVEQRRLRFQAMRLAA